MTGCTAGGRRTRKHKLRGGNFVGATADPALGTAGMRYDAITNNGGMNASEIPASDISGGRRRKGMTTKAMKKLLKKAGMKTTGKKAALTRRLKKMGRGMRGGAAGVIPSQAASAGYTGEGTAGLISPVDVSTPRAGGVVPV